MLIEAEHITKHFYGITAVDDVTLTVEKGETLGIIGTNGAGKTTLFNIMTGFTHADNGTILYRKKNITNLKPQTLVKLKFARTFQNLRLFYPLSVYDNVLISTIACKKSPKTADDLLRLAELWDKRNHLSSALSYGEMRRLELVRAVATGAEVLFLDEPSAAMTRPEALVLDTLIKTLKGTFDLTVVMIEHNMELVRLGCDRVYAMDRGRIVCSGTPQKVLCDPAVTQTMLPTR